MTPERPVAQERPPDPRANNDQPNTQDTFAGRPRPFEGIDRAGMPARDHTAVSNLASAEVSAFRRFSPRRNRWSEVVEFDRRVAELEERQRTITAKLAELADLRATSPARDADALAEWLVTQKGPRPVPDADVIDEQTKHLREDFDALTTAIGKVLEEKARFVEKHRRRLTKDADRAVEEAHARVVALIDEAAEARQALVDARQTAIWAHVYPDGSAGRMPPQTLLAGGVARVAQEAFGVAAQAQAPAIYRALQQDAAWLATAATAEQAAAMGALDPHASATAAAWADSDEARDQRRADNERQLQAYKREWGREPA